MKNGLISPVFLNASHAIFLIIQSLPLILSFAVFKILFKINLNFEFIYY